MNQNATYAKLGHKFNEYHKIPTTYGLTFTRLNNFKLDKSQISSNIQAYSVPLRLCRSLNYISALAIAAF